MFTHTPVLTETGMTLLLRAAAGEKITFTKFQIGKGTWTDGGDDRKRTALKTLVFETGIVDADVTVGEGYMQLQGSFDNGPETVQADFPWTELGVIAEDEEENEYLYAYAYEDSFAELIKRGDSSVVIEQRISVIVAIGTSENVKAYILPNATYASKEDFDAHTEAVNPHGLTCETIGASATGHTHSASDIKSGVLPLSRGGTGVSSKTALINMLIGDIPRFKAGVFTGNGARNRAFDLGFPAKFVMIFRASAEDDSLVGTNAPIVAAQGMNYFYNVRGGSATMSAEDLMAIGRGGLAVTETGFVIGYNDTVMLNASNTRYAYIALA